MTELSDFTKLMQEDIILTLESLNLVKYWRGSYILKNITLRLLENHSKKKNCDPRVRFRGDCLLAEQIPNLKSKQLVSKATPKK